MDIDEITRILMENPEQLPDVPEREARHTRLFTSELYDGGPLLEQYQKQGLPVECLREAEAWLVESEEEGGQPILLETGLFCQTGCIQTTYSDAGVCLEFAVPLPMATELFLELNMLCSPGVRCSHYFLPFSCGRIRFRPENSIFGIRSLLYINIMTGKKPLVFGSRVLFSG